MSKSSILRFPKNDDTFEDLCLDLYKEILEDPFIQRNGGRGYGQNGVDIYSDKDGKIIGIQCKQKNILKDKKLTERIITDEVEEAKSFKPPLSEYIIATTALRDPKIQELAREITKKHSKKGLFSVKIRFWEDLSHDLYKYQDILDDYDLVATFNKLEPLENKNDEILSIVTRIEKSVSSLSPEVSNEVPKIYISNLNHAKKLLENSKPDEAFDFLKGIKDNTFSEINKKHEIVKYEILKLMGIAKHRLLQNSEAGNLLKEAYQYNENDEKAKLNKAWGYFLLNQKDEAKIEVEKILEDDPENISANQIFVYSSSDEPLDAIISKIDPSLRESKDIAYAIGIIAREKELFDDSEKWLRIALKNGNNDFTDLKGNLGEVILFNLVENPSIIYTNQISLSNKKKLLEAKKLLEEAWKKLPSNEIKKTRISWIANLSVIKKLIGDLEGALSDINIALELNPSNSSIKAKAIILSYLNRSNEAITLLKNLNEEKCPEKQLLLAQALIFNNEHEKSIEVLEDLLKKKNSDKLNQETIFLLLQLYIQKNDLDNAFKLHNFFYGENTDDLLGLIFVHNISVLKEDFIEANSSLDKAIEIAGKSDSIREISILADTLYQNKRLEDAAKIYEKFVNKKVDHMLTHRLVDCYYRTGEIGKAFNICKELREIYKNPLQYITEVEISISTEISDFAIAKELCDEYLKNFPSNLDMEINRAIINLHTNEVDKVDEFLNHRFDLEKLTLKQFEKLAYLYRFRALDNEYLELLYEMRRKYFNSDEAHAEYVKSLISKNIGSESTPIKVDLGMAVRLKNNSNIKEWFILEERNDTDKKFKEVNQDDLLSKKLVGKYLGDTITIGEGISESEVIIDEIKTKYVYASHESIEILKYSEEDFGFYQIPMGHDEDKKFDPLFDILNERHKHLIKMEKFFKEKIIPVGTFAKFTGSNVIKTWSNIVNNPDLNLKCCSDRDKKNLLLLKNEKKLIIDLISLLTIHETKIKDVIVKSFGKLGIAQTTIDEIIQDLNEQEMLKERGSFYTGISSEEEITLKDIHLENIENNIKYLEDLLEWIKQNCDIIPCRAALKINRYERAKYNNMVGKSFMDTILIASENGNLLYSDDGPLRILAKEKFNVEGVSTLNVLKRSLEMANLKLDDYNNVIVKLICFNYITISFNAEIIMTAAKESKWLSSYPYNKFIDVITHEIKQPNLPKVVHDFNNAEVILKKLDEIKITAGLVGVLEKFISKLSENSISKQNYESLINYLLFKIACRTDGYIILEDLAFEISNPIINRYNSLKELI
jgi:hypothetical protein